MYLDPSVPIVNKDGKVEPRFHTMMLKLLQLPIITGSGSPEGVVSASSTRLYMDTDGTAGNILYIKRDESIAKDRTQGWILV